MYIDVTDTWAYTPIAKIINNDTFHMRTNKTELVSPEMLAPKANRMIEETEGMIKK
jgi:hypothetical protein